MGSCCRSASAQLWMQVQHGEPGAGLRIHAGVPACIWSYVPHFIHTPFYVYAYAFGDCLVNALYAVFQDRTSGFQAKYLDMLRAGGTKRHRELLAPFGLECVRSGVLARGLDIIAGFIDELEVAADESPPPLPTCRSVRPRIAG